MSVYLLPQQNAQDVFNKLQALAKQSQDDAADSKAPSLTANDFDAYTKANPGNPFSLTLTDTGHAPQSITNSDVIKRLYALMDKDRDGTLDEDVRQYGEVVDGGANTAAPSHRTDGELFHLYKHSVFQVKTEFQNTANYNLTYGVVVETKRNNNGTFICTLVVTSSSATPPGIADSKLTLTSMDEQLTITQIDDVRTDLLAGVSYITFTTQSPTIKPLVIASDISVGDDVVVFYDPKFTPSTISASVSAVKAFDGAEFFGRTKITPERIYTSGMYSQPVISRSGQIVGLADTSDIKANTGVADLYVTPHNVLTHSAAHFVAATNGNQKHFVYNDFGFKVNPLSKPERDSLLPAEQNGSTAVGQVTHVTQGSPAEQAGLKTTDIVLSVTGYDGVFDNPQYSDAEFTGMNLFYDDSTPLEMKVYNVLTHDVRTVLLQPQPMTVSSPVEFATDFGITVYESNPQLTYLRNEAVTDGIHYTVQSETCVLKYYDQDEFMITGIVVSGEVKPVSSVAEFESVYTELMQSGTQIILQLAPSATDDRRLLVPLTNNVKE